MQPFPDFNVIRTIDADLERLRRGLAFEHETHRPVERQAGSLLSRLSRRILRPDGLGQPETTSACGD